jgi:hypothetical protein
MCQKDLASGAMIDLSDAYGQVPLDVSIFFLAGDEEAQKMVARLSSDNHAFAPQVQA